MTPNRLTNAQKIPIMLGPILIIIGILVNFSFVNLLKRLQELRGLCFCTRKQQRRKRVRYALPHFFLSGIFSSMCSWRSATQARGGASRLRLILGSGERSRWRGDSFLVGFQGAFKELLSLAYGVG